MAENALVPLPASVGGQVTVDVHVFPDLTGVDQLDTAAQDWMGSVELDLPRCVVCWNFTVATVAPLGIWLLAEVTVAVRVPDHPGVGDPGPAVRLVTELSSRLSRGLAPVT